MSDLKVQKVVHTIPAIFSLTLLLLLGCDGEWNTKGPPYHCYSRTIEESKEKGVFQFEVTADKSTIMLDSAYNFQIQSAWVENPWSRQAVIFGKSPFWKNDSSYQVIMNLNIDNVNGQGATRHYYFIGNKPLDTFISYFSSNYYSNNIDTIKIPLFREIYSKLPSRKERRAFDTLTFVRRINSR